MGLVDRKIYLFIFCYNQFISKKVGSFDLIGLQETITMPLAPLANQPFMDPNATRPLAEEVSFIKKRYSGLIFLQSHICYSGHQFYLMQGHHCRLQLPELLLVVIEPICMTPLSR